MVTRKLTPSSPTAAPKAAKAATKTRPAATATPSKKARPAQAKMPAKVPAKAATQAKAAAPAKAKAKAAPKPGKPPKINWKPQTFVASHAKDGQFKTGLRSYAAYRDLLIEQATGGAVQAHVIRLLGKCDPKVVSIPHYHGVQFQFLYMLKGWMVGEYEGAGRIKMTAGSCWIQPPGIRHQVLDYSDGCEMLEIILPAKFKTVEL
ncbi:MAG: cupin domain-containing protein [Betaproteobacteria bacterium]